MAAVMVQAAVGCAAVSGGALAVAFISVNIVPWVCAARCRDRLPLRIVAAVSWAGWPQV
jgi:hypothetical protein